MSSVRCVLRACAVMTLVLFPALPVQAWPTIGLSPQELEVIIGRRMRQDTHHGGQIHSPEVSLDAQQQAVVVCAKWQMGYPRASGDVCAAGKPVWDRTTCEVRLQSPRLIKATLSGGGQLPSAIADFLNLLMGAVIKELPAYKANALACFLVKEIRVTPDRLEIHL